MSDFSGATIHANLGEAFFDPVHPADFPQAVLRYRNQRWAGRMGLAGLTDAQWVKHFGRFAPLPGSFETPVAMRYHGHQFQSYNSDIRDDALVARWRRAAYAQGRRAGGSGHHHARGARR